MVWIGGTQKRVQIIENQLFVPFYCDPDWTRTNDLLLSIPLWFSPLPNVSEFDGLDYNFTISGATRLVSTELPDNPRQT